MAIGVRVGFRIGFSSDQELLGTTRRWGLVTGGSQNLLVRFLDSVLTF
jgi:hypothetical protein